MTILQRTKLATVQLLAVASASAAATCLLVWAVSMTTPKVDFTTNLPPLFWLSLCRGSLEFGHSLYDLREIRYYEKDGIHPALKPGWRLPGLRYRPHKCSDEYWIASVSLLIPGVLLGPAAWLLTRTCRRMRKASAADVAGAGVPKPTPPTALAPEHGTEFPPPLS